MIKRCFEWIITMIIMKALMIFEVFFSVSTQFTKHDNVFYTTLYFILFWKFWNNISNYLIKLQGVHIISLLYLWETRILLPIKYITYNLYYHINYTWHKKYDNTYNNIYTLLKFFLKIQNRNFMTLEFVDEIRFELCGIIHVPSSVFQDFSHDWYENEIIEWIVCLIVSTLHRIRASLDHRANYPKAFIVLHIIGKQRREWFSFLNKKEETGLRTRQKICDCI